MTTATVPPENAGHVDHGLSVTVTRLKADHFQHDGPCHQQCLILGPDLGPGQLEQ